MTSKTATRPVFDYTGNPTTIPYDNAVTVFEKGADAFEKYEVGAEIDLKLTNGETRVAVVQATQVAPLIDLMANQGAEIAYTRNRPFSRVALVKAMARDAGAEVLDVTKLYTAVTLSVSSSQVNMVAGN